MKRLFIFGAFISIIALTGCSTTSSFTDFTAKYARSIETSYDMQLVSNESTVCKVYKLISKQDSKVYYAISEADYGWKSVNAEELNDFVVITKDNAKDLSNFIDTITATYQSEKRNGQNGILYDIAIVRDYTYQAMTVDSITTSDSFTSGHGSSYSYSGSSGSNDHGYGSKSSYGSSSSFGSEVTKSMKEFAEEDELVRIQVKTVDNEDIIVFAIAGAEAKVSIEELQDFKAVISK